MLERLEKRTSTGELTVSTFHAFALSVLDLPFKAGAHAEKLDDIVVEKLGLDCPPAKLEWRPIALPLRSSYSGCSGSGSGTGASGSNHDSRTSTTPRAGTSAPST